MSRRLFHKPGCNNNDYPPPKTAGLEATFCFPPTKEKRKKKKNYSRCTAPSGRRCRTMQTRKPHANEIDNPRKKKRSPPLPSRNNDPPSVDTHHLSTTTEDSSLAWKVKERRKSLRRRLSIAMVCWLAIVDCTPCSPRSLPVFFFARPAPFFLRVPLTRRFVPFIRPFGFAHRKIIASQLALLSIHSESACQYFLSPPPFSKSSAVLRWLVVSQ